MHLWGAGRMYVFEQHVCFHSNVFGYVKNKIIPLRVRDGVMVSIGNISCQAGPLLLSPAPLETEQE